MLSVRNISKTFDHADGQVRALDDVSLDVAAGQFVVVRGASGCGKTTLLLAAGGLLAPNEGQVEVDGRDPYAMSPNERAGFRARSIGFVFQQFHLVPYLSVTANVLTPAMVAGTPDAAGRAGRLIEQFGLSDRAGHLPGELSVGERQRTALARAMMNRPKLVLADEPTGNLDADNGRIVLESLAEFAAGGGAVLLVTHDPGVDKHAHQTVRLLDGRLSSH